MAEPPTFYCLEVETLGVTAQVGLNGAPLAVDETGEGFLTIKTINEWLLPANNRLTALLAAPSDPRYARLGPRLKARVFRADPSSPVPKAAEVLCELVWPEEDRPAGVPPTALPCRLSASVDLETAGGGEVWTDAAPVEAPTDADLDAILAETETFRRAVLEGRGEDAWTLVSYKLEDEARANGFDMAKLKHASLTAYRLFVNQPGVQAPPLSRDEAELTSVAGGRLWLLGRGPSTKTILIEGDKRISWITLYFGKVDGRWRIAR